MEGRSNFDCADCGRPAEIAGEMPEEYGAAFAQIVVEGGWVPKPGGRFGLICGACAARYAGNESVDDQEKVSGFRDPKEL